MNSPQGSARTPAGLDRDESISPQPLDSTTETSLPPSPLSEHSPSDDSLHNVGIAVNSLFSQLPPSVITRILWAVDANSFASLCVLNKQWRAEAERVELYAHHLSRCPSYALSNSLISGPFRRNDLSRIKAKFAAEVRRNLFDAYLHPRRTFISLISINANSSAAFPTGEAFRFEFSPNGRTVLALSSTRIYVIDATSDPPQVKRHLKTLRRPLSASVTDDGSLLAVLSSKHQVNIYGLTIQGVQHLQVIVLDNPPKIIAIAHEGTVLAVSYETGIEVFSLAANSLTTDRRAVRSEAVDTLRFSGDGSMLVGSSLSLDDPNAVVISAPFYTENDPDLSPREVHSRMWTTQILFPQISSVCSHVTLLPGHTEGDALWLFAFDHSLMSYRAVRTDDTRAGVAYFLSPPGADRFDTPVPTIAPSASVCGTLAVAGFEGAGLCIYGIPERLDISPDMGAVIERQNERQRRNMYQLTSATGNMEPLMAYSPSTSASDYAIEDDSLANKVDWRQSLFIKCRNINGLYGQTAARWVEHREGTGTQLSKRLIVVAPGGVSLDANELGDEMMPVDGSRMCLLDFDYLPSSLPDRTLTIEVGEDQAELLTEHTGSLANEVAMERRRTIRAIPVTEDIRMPLGRSFTSISPPITPLIEEGVRRGSVSTPSSPVETSRSSQIYAASGLHRAATASGFRHARYPPRPPLGSSQYIEQNGNQRSSYYHRPTSEASWETPPPPYTGGNSPSLPHPPSHQMMSSIGYQAQLQTHPALRNPSPQSAQPQYRPYRALVAERANSTANVEMTAHAMPTDINVNQYQQSEARNRLSGVNNITVNTGAGVAWNPTQTPDFGPSNRMSYVSRTGVDTFDRARPTTHHSHLPQSWQNVRRSITMPSSPVTADVTGVFDHQNGMGLPPPGTATRMSLTGANLQNRLNHPVPPIPEAHASLEHPTTYTEPIYSSSHRPVVSIPEEANSFPAMPTFDQMANLNRRMSQSEMQRPVGVKNTDFVHRNPAAVVPPSPPRGAWGAAGIPGAPTFHQARNVPNGFSHCRTGSRGSQTSNMASASAPNLLLQRPRYGRLDTIESLTDTYGHSDINGGRRSRAQSMTQAPIMAHVEPSAYHETSSAGPGQASTKLAKKPKKTKEETKKKGSRCVVM